MCPCRGVRDCKLPLYSSVLVIHTVGSCGEGTAAATELLTWPPIPYTQGQEEAGNVWRLGPALTVCWSVWLHWCNRRWLQSQLGTSPLQQRKTDSNSQYADRADCTPCPVTSLKCTYQEILAMPLRTETYRAVEFLLSFYSALTEMNASWSQDLAAPVSKM